MIYFIQTYDFFRGNFFASQDSGALSANRYGHNGSNFGKTHRYTYKQCAEWKKWSFGASRDKLVLDNWKIRPKSDNLHFPSELLRNLFDFRKVKFKG